MKKDKPNSPSKGLKVHWASSGNLHSEKKRCQGKRFQLFGIFGYPLSHTLSPVMHEAAFRKLGINASYIVLELPPAAFKKLMTRSSGISLSGFNITVPYKEVVMKYLDKILPDARAIGAVNTVYRDGKYWVGTNTDAEGFLIALKKDGKFHPLGKKAAVLGAGGAARAVIYGLSKEGAREILVVDCFPEKAQKIINDMRTLFPRISYQAALAGTEEVKGAIEKADVIINATPLGLKRQDPPVVPDSWIPEAGARQKFFMDLVYNPSSTPFLRAAKKKGHRISNGLGMLLYQGARALECWTGQKAPVPEMRGALLQAQFSVKKFKS